MSDLWEQAQEAVAAGNNARAHVLLANLLRDERQHVQAWYLLSTIAPSAEQQEVFLQRVLKLEPYHAQAQARLAQLEGLSAASEPAPAMPISTAADDFEAQAQGDTLPPWLAKDAGLLVADEADETAEPDIDMEPETPVEEIPDWLREMPGQDWEDELTAEPEPAAPAAPAKRKTPARTQESSKVSPLMLMLIGATTVVLIVLIYVLVTLAPGLF
jgi:hypothetical protein